MWLGLLVWIVFRVLSETLPRVSEYILAAGPLEPSLSSDAYLEDDKVLDGNRSAFDSFSENSEEVMYLGNDRLCCLA
jgi:hypothetical protein